MIAGAGIALRLGLPRADEQLPTHGVVPLDYRISPDGERLAAELLADWDRIDTSVRKLGQGGREA